MTDKNTEAAYRLNVIRIGLAFTWVAVGGYTWFVTMSGPPSVDERITVIIGAIAATLTLTLLPWRWLLTRLLGDVAILGWVSAIAIAVTGLPELRDPETVIFILIGTAAFSTATLLSWPAAVSSVLVIIGAFIGAELARTGGSELVQASRMIGFSLTLAMVVLGQSALARRVLSANEALTAVEDAQLDLQSREAELDQMYSVSRTIGTGQDLSEVLPDLVGRVVAAANATSGVVLLHDGEAEALRLMSPIWSHGGPLPAERPPTPVSSTTVAAEVFRTMRPVLISASEAAEDELLRELGPSEVVVIPLRAGTDVIGVLIIGRQEGPAFTEVDLAVIQALAGPAGLVLNQLARYEEARAMGEKMGELAQLKTDFVSVVSHELRTPLTSIIGSLKTLQRPQLAPRDPDGLILLDTAVRQADRLKALIEDLLVVSRIDNRALPVRPERLDLRVTLNDIVDSIPGAAQYTSVHVDESARDAIADPEHIRRILTNLVENALRYAARAQIEVTAVRSDGDVHIRVADHGPGIPAQYVDRIFDRFVQVDRKSDQGRGGTGLGLSIVRGLAEAMGGRVWYEHSAYDIGAVFVVAIPLRAGSRQAAGI